VLVALLAAPPAAAQLHVTGRWSPPFGMDAVAIHTTLLRGPQDAWRFTWWSGFDGLKLHAWDYVPGPFDSTTSFASRTQPATPDNFYECGFTNGASGRLISLGGLFHYHDDGSRRAAVYDPVTQASTIMTPLLVERFEPSLTTLADGRLLVAGGIRWVYAAGFGGRAPRPGAPLEREAKGDLLRLALHPVPEWQDSTEEGWGTSRRPPPLVHHSAVVDGSRLLVYGGHDDTAPSGPEVVNGDVWQLTRWDEDHTRQVLWTWDTVKTAADPGAGRPDGRWAHAAVFTSDRRMIVFGGRNASGALGDVWQLQLAVPFGASAPWTLLTPTPDPVHGVPSARFGHAAIYHASANRMVLFGGRDAGALAADDCWELTLDATPAWHRLTSSGTPREGATAVQSGISYPRAWVFGGRGSGGVRNDVMEYRLDLGTWRTLTLAAGSPVPPARADHAAFLGGDDAMTISGGELADGTLDDRVWRLRFVAPFFEPTLLTWTLDPLQAKSPGPRAGHTLSPEGGIVTARRLEIYDPDANTGGVPGATLELPASTRRFTYFYPTVVVLPGGRLFHANGTNTGVLDLATSTWTSVPGGIPGGTAGQTIHYAPGKVMRCGGNSRAGLTDVIAFDAQDQTTGWTTWTLGKLQSRILHKATVLPTGDVLVTGGVNNIFDPVGTRRPQLWNDVTGWSDSTTLASEPVHRSYHGTATLLPDSRVLTSGGFSADASPLQGCVYEPPYLFDTNGDLVRQTLLTGVPDTAAYGTELVLGTEVAADAADIVGACLLRTCSVTHDVSFDQRRVPLAFTLDGGEVHVTLPTSANLAPPGDYMLFLLRNVDGVAVPSVAQWIRLRAGPLLSVPPSGAPRLTFARPWPNPALRGVQLRWTLAVPAEVRLHVIDAAGRRVRRIAMREGLAGENRAQWDGRDDRGRTVAAGLYFVRLEAAGEIATWPVTIAR
jgi:hypothetical protein